MVWEGYRTGRHDIKQYREDMFTGRLRVDAVDKMWKNGRDRHYMGITTHFIGYIKFNIFSLVKE